MPGAIPPRGDGTAAHAAPATSSPGWSEVAVATITYVIHPARLQVWGGNCAIFEVSLGSFLITSVASRQRSRPGHAPGRRDGGWGRDSDGRDGDGHASDNRGQRQPRAVMARAAVAAAVVSEGGDSSCTEGQFQPPAPPCSQLMDTFPAPEMPPRWVRWLPGRDAGGRCCRAA